MKFLSLFTSLKLKISSMMGVSTIAQNVISAGSNNAIQSPNNFWETLGIYILHTIADILIYGWELIVRVFYAILRWLLVIIDFLFILIRQMIGLNTDFGNVEELTQSDMIFKFVFSDSVLNVIKGMIGFCLILLILFCIFAIVKSEYDFVAHGGDNSKGRILSRTLKSLMLMILVPVLFIGGLMLSNAILKSLYIASAGGKDTSLGTQIFISSTYDANAYRRYANRGFKIPITYNFDDVGKNDNITGWGNDGEIAELDSALAAFNSSSVWNRGYTTFIMFYNNGFLDMDSVDRLNLTALRNGKQSSYQGTYDKNIYSNKEQYYIMADLIEYAMRSGEKLYIKSAENLYNSYYDMYNDPTVPTEVKNKMLDYTPITYNSVENVYNVSIHYKDYNSPITFAHKKGTASESDGSLFLIAVEESITYNNNVYTYYYPLLSTDRDFQTNYYEKIKQPIVAKGLFENGEYPTAIREQDGVVKFYRDDLNIPAIIDFFPTISYEMPPEGVTEDILVKAIKGGLEAISGVDITQFIPYVYYSFDLFSLFTKKTYNIIELDDGYIHISYNFEQKGYTMQNVYKLGDLNFNLLVMAFSSIIILGMLLKILFGIALRVFDVVLMAITYPAVLSTFPLDGGERFSNWTSILIKKVLGIYGVVIGINLVLMLFPFISNLEIFTPQMIETAVNSKMLPMSISPGFLNLIFRILFQLVAFTMLESATTLIDSIINKSKQKDEGGLLKDGAEVIEAVKQVPQKVGYVLTGQIVIDAGKKALETATSFIPGGAIVSDIADKVKQHKKQKMMSMDIKDLKKQMANGDTTGFVQKENEDKQANAENEAPKDEEQQETPNTNQNNDGNNNQETPNQEENNNQETPTEEGGENQETPTEEGGENQETPTEEGGNNQEPPTEEGGEDQEPPTEEGGNNQETPTEEGGENQETPTEDEKKTSNDSNGGDKQSDTSTENSDDTGNADKGSETKNDGTNTNKDNLGDKNSGSDTKETPKEEPKKEEKPQETPKEEPKEDKPQETPKEEPKEDKPQETSKEEPKEDKLQETPKEEPKEDKPQETPKEEPKEDKPQEEPKEESKDGDKKDEKPAKDGGDSNSEEPIGEGIGKAMLGLGLKAVKKVANPLTYMKIASKLIGATYKVTKAGVKLTAKAAKLAVKTGKFALDVAKDPKQALKTGWEKTKAGARKVKEGAKFVGTGIKGLKDALPDLIDGDFDLASEKIEKAYADKGYDVEAIEKNVERKVLAAKDKFDAFKGKVFTVKDKAKSKFDGVKEKFDNTKKYWERKSANKNKKKEEKNSSE